MIAEIPVTEKKKEPQTALIAKPDPLNEKEDDSQEIEGEQEVEAEERKEGEEGDEEEQENVDFEENKEDIIFKNLETHQPRNATENFKMRLNTFDEELDNYRASKKRKQTSVKKRTNKSLINKAQAYLPIDQRIFKEKSTRISIILTNTILTGIRNIMNDGKSKLIFINPNIVRKQSLLFNSSSFSIEDLDMLKEEIESKKSKKNGIVNPLDTPLTIFSLSTLESLEAIMNNEGE